MFSKALAVVPLAICLYFVFLISKRTTNKMCDQSFSPMDPSSFSRPDQAKVTNIHVDLELHFETTSASGYVDLTVEKVSKDAKHLILDSQDLTIESIFETKLNVNVPYKLCPSVGQFGSKLVVDLPQNDANTYLFRIKYKTSSEAKGFQWLTPEQTSTKKLSYLFSQFEAISCRSIIPLQDTPGVKTPYTANITAPSAYTVLMSAISSGSKKLNNDKTVHSFEQKIPIPSYLIAIVAGALKSRDVSDRIRVWSEEGIVDEAYEEFKETEVKLKTAEAICGPYIWGRYDLLILPPSFPFGGMENPCLTFVTPTLLAGDKSLTNVIAHEIAHSWTGNLVTNKNFEHFWLNEGFTVYLERRILAKLEGVPAQDLAAAGGLEELRETINEQFGSTNPLTCLVPKLPGVHPDDSFSKVPYEKGSLFLRYLESIVGGPDVFEVFLRKYFDTYKFKSLDTEEFKAFFNDYFKNVDKTKEIDWNSWLHKPGMPDFKPNYDRSLLQVIEAVKKKITDQTDNFTKADLAPLSPTQKIILMQFLTDEKLTKEQAKKIGEVFETKSLKNCEMLFSWYRICLKAGIEDNVDEILKWISEVGRMKYVRPLYRDMYNFEVVRAKAIENYKKTKPAMMHVTAYTVGQDLKLN